MFIKNISEVHPWSEPSLIQVRLSAPKNFSWTLGHLGPKQQSIDFLGVFTTQTYISAWHIAVTFRDRNGEPISFENRFQVVIGIVCLQGYHFLWSMPACFSDSCALQKLAQSWHRTLHLRCWKDATRITSGPKHGFISRRKITSWCCVECGKGAICGNPSRRNMRYNSRNAAWKIRHFSAEELILCVPVLCLVLASSISERSFVIYSTFTTHAYFSQEGQLVFQVISF